MIRSAAATGALLLFFLVIGAPVRLAAQSTEEFDWSTETSLWAANAALGGVSAGVVALIRGDPPVPAFLRGAGGGTLVYVGKRVAVRDGFGTGFIGRQISSVGGSIVGNAVAGEASLDRVAFGIGPVRLYAGRDAPGLEWALDVPAVASTIWHVAVGGTLDVAESLSSGAVVLRGCGDGALPGTVCYTPSGNPERQSYVLAHEQVHVLQYDQSFLSWGAPLEDWAARRVPKLEKPLDHLDFNLPVLATAAILGFFVWTEHHEQLWEREAMYLGRTR